MTSVRHAVHAYWGEQHKHNHAGVQFLLCTRMQMMQNVKIPTYLKFKKNCPSTLVRDN